MSKVLAAMSATGGAAVVAVGGSYVLQGNGSGKDANLDNGDDHSKTPDTKKKELLFKSVGDFENEWKNKSKCVTDLFTAGFADDDKRTTASEIKSDNKPDDNTFFTTPTGSSDPYKSCLIIDWKREDYSNGKWKGTFTWTWTFVKGNSGFVNFNIAETSSTEIDKLQFTGVFYLLGKGANSTDKWEVKHKKEVKDNPKKVEVKDLDSHFPKKGTGVTTNKDDYWGFFKSTTSGQQLQNICGSSDCTASETEPVVVDGIELSWEGSNTTPSSGKKLKDWSSSEEWWSKIYENSSWDLVDKIKDFSGTWKETTNAASTPQRSQ